MSKGQSPDIVAEIRLGHGFGEAEPVGVANTPDRTIVVWKVLRGLKQYIYIACINLYDYSIEPAVNGFWALLMWEQSDSVKDAPSGSSGFICRDVMFERGLFGSF